MDALPASDLHARDWSELPLPALTSLFTKLSAVDVLMGAGLVCQSWLEAAKSPCLWHDVDMSHKTCHEKVLVDECPMAKVAVDRSGGQLEAFVGEGFVTDDLLKYIGERSPSLKCLGLISCIDVSDEGFTELLARSPLLEDLTIMGCDNIGGEACVVAARACPQLKRLVLYKRSSSCSPPSSSSGEWITVRRYVKSNDALGIAKMRELRELTLVGSDIDDLELEQNVQGSRRSSFLDFPIQMKINAAFADEFRAIDCDFVYWRSETLRSRLNVMRIVYGCCYLSAQSIRIALFFIL